MTHQVGEWINGEYVVRDMTPEEEAQWVIDMTPTEPQMRAQVIAALKFHWQNVALGWGYDSIVEAISYAEDDSVPQYQAEGKALRVWRSLTRTQVEQAVSDNMGAMPMPEDTVLLAGMSPPPARPVDPPPVDPVESDTP